MRYLKSYLLLASVIGWLCTVISGSLNAAERTTVTFPLQSQSAYQFIEWDPDPVYEAYCDQDGIETMLHYSWNGVRQQRVIYSFDIRQLPRNAVITYVMPRIWALRMCIEHPANIRGWVNSGDNSPHCSDCMDYQQAFLSGGCLRGAVNQSVIFDHSGVTINEYVNAELHNPPAPNQDRGWQNRPARMEAILNRTIAAHSQYDEDRHFIFFYFTINKTASNSSTARAELYGNGTMGYMQPTITITYELPPEVNDVVLFPFDPEVVYVDEVVTAHGELSGTGDSPVTYQWVGTTPSGSFESDVLTTFMSNGSGSIPHFSDFPTNTAGEYSMQVYTVTPNSMFSNTISYTVYDFPMVADVHIDWISTASPGQDGTLCATGALSGSGDGAIGYQWRVTQPDSEEYISELLWVELINGTCDVPIFCSLPTAVLGDHYIELEIVSPHFALSDATTYTVGQANLLYGYVDSDSGIVPGESVTLRYDMYNPNDTSLTLGLTGRFRVAGTDTWYTDPIEVLNRIEVVLDATSNATAERVFMIDTNTPPADTYEFALSLHRVLGDDWLEEVAVFYLDYETSSTTCSASAITALVGASPNPCNQSTAITFSLALEADVTLAIYDSGGRLIRTLVVAAFGPGYHTVVWNGYGNCGNAVASGVYYCRLAALGITKTERLVLLR